MVISSALKTISETQRPDQSYGHASLEEKEPSIAHLFSSDNAFAPVNIPVIFITLDTSQSDRSWLKLDAELNIWAILNTLETSQSPISRLKLLIWNIPHISASLEGFQVEISPLNPVLLSNIPLKLTTLDTSQSNRSWLKLFAALNIRSIIVTLDTSQVEISPLKS